MKFHRMYALSLRHIYLIKSSLPRILDLIYWPTIQIVLWGFISMFFTLHSDYYNHTAGIILSAAILYDFLFRSSISFNMLFLEEIWSRNFTNLFVAPLKVSEIITALASTAFLRTLIGIVPAIVLMNPFFGVSLLEMGPPLSVVFKKNESSLVEAAGAAGSKELERFNREAGGDRRWQEGARLRGVWHGHRVLDGTRSALRRV